MTLFEFQKAIIDKEPSFRGKEESLKELHSIANKDEKELLISLLNRFYHISLKDKNAFRLAFTEYLIKNEKVINTPLLFGTLVQNDAPDSGQKIIYDIETAFEKKVRDARLIDPNFTPKSYFKNHFGKVQSQLTNNPDTNFLVVLTDEFIGSGETLLNRLNIIHQFSNIEEVHVYFLAGMRYAIDTINEKYPEVIIHVNKVLDKGISEFYDQNIINDKLEQMRNLEASLKQTINNYPLSDYSLGYNQAESLYNNNLIDGNIPNNVFPIFWWPLNQKNQVRNSVFVRTDDKIKW